MATRLILIAVFGGAGSIARYLVSIGAQPLAERLRTPLPLGTLVCNVTGSLAIGAVGAWFMSRGVSENVRLAALVGFLGGYTTFSAYAWDTLQLAERGQPGAAFLNFVLNNALSFFGVWIGFKLAARALIAGTSS